MDFEAEPPPRAARRSLDRVPRAVQIEGERMAVVPEPDSGGGYRGVEKAKNVGTRAYREILIELKD